MIEFVAGGPDPEKVAEDTFGHLKSTPNEPHSGTIDFAVGECCHSAACVIEVQLAGVEPSPWFHEQVHDWIDRLELDPGCYRFTGWYQHDGQEGRFSGSVKKVNISPVGPEVRS